MGHGENDVTARLTRWGEETVQNEGTTITAHSRGGFQRALPVFRFELSYLLRRDPFILAGEISRPNAERPLSFRG